MMKAALLKFLLLSTLLFGASASVGAPTKKKAWVTIGDAALRQVKSFAPDLVSIGSRQLGPPGASEKVHAVVMDHSRLAVVSGAIHQKMGQCGGFMYHSSEAEARAALERRPADPPTRAGGIQHRELVEPMLAEMQEKNIEATILALSAFTNRYYTSQSGVDAANWLTAAWRALGAGRDDVSVSQVVH